MQKKRGRKCAFQCVVLKEDRVGRLRFSSIWRNSSIRRNEVNIRSRRKRPLAAKLEMQRYVSRDYLTAKYVLRDYATAKTLFPGENLNPGKKHLVLIFADSR